DDFLIDRTTLTRTYHPAKYHDGNPVLTPERDWEKAGGPCAMVFSDGVWYDPADRLYKIWYMGGLTRSTCYATSQDGLAWEKTKLDVKEGTNVVQPDGRDSSTVWLDMDEKEPKCRFKMVRAHRHDGGWALALYLSADGVHWGEPAAVSGPCGDRTTFFYNPF